MIHDARGVSLGGDGGRLSGVQGGDDDDDNSDLGTDGAGSGVFKTSSSSSSGRSSTGGGAASGGSLPPKSLQAPSLSDAVIKSSNKRNKDDAEQPSSSTDKQRATHKYAITPICNSTLDPVPDTNGLYLSPIFIYSFPIIYHLITLIYQL